MCPPPPPPTTPPPSSPTYVTQTVQVGENWNYVSFYVTQPDMLLNTVFNALEKTDRDYVKSQREFSEWYDSFNTWYGTLVSVNPDEGYMLKVAKSGTVKVMGDAVTFPKVVQLSKGWNFLANPYPVDVDLATNMPTPTSMGAYTAADPATYEPTNTIKAIRDFAEWYDETLTGGAPMWYGPLKVLHSGQMFKFKVGKSGSVTWNENSGATVASPPPPGRRQLIAAGWAVDSSLYQDTMPVTALVTIDGVPQSKGTLIALVGDEVRGVREYSSKVTFGPFAGKALFMMDVSTNHEGTEEVQFKFSTDDVSAVALDKVVSMTDGTSVGSAIAPLLLVATASSPVVADNRRALRAGQAPVTPSSASPVTIVALVAAVAVAAVIATTRARRAEM